MFSVWFEQMQLPGCIRIYGTLQFKGDCLPLRQYSKFYRTMEKHYVSPEMEVTDMMSEGVLCASELLDMDPEDGNM